MLERYENLKRIYNISKRQLENANKKDETFEKYQNEVKNAKKEMDEYYKKNEHELEKLIIKKEFNKDIDIYNTSYANKKVMKKVKKKEELIKEFENLKTNDKELLKVINSYKKYLINNLDKTEDIEIKGDENVLSLKSFLIVFIIILFISGLIIHLTSFILFHFIAPFSFQVFLIESQYSFFMATIISYYFYNVTSTKLTSKILLKKNMINPKDKKKFIKIGKYVWLITLLIQTILDIIINNVFKYQSNLIYYFSAVIIIYIYSYHAYQKYFIKEIENR